VSGRKEESQKKKEKTLATGGSSYQEVSGQADVEDLSRNAVRWGEKRPIFSKKETNLARTIYSAFAMAGRFLLCPNCTN